MKTFWVYLLMVFFLISCAPVRVPIKVSCPPRPIMKIVVVKENAIAGPELTNVITNFQALWAHIHLVETLGCIR